MHICETMRCRVSIDFIWPFGRSAVVTKQNKTKQQKTKQNKTKQKQKQKQKKNHLGGRGLVE